MKLCEYNFFLLVYGLCDFIVIEWFVKYFWGN